MIKKIFGVKIDYYNIKKNNDANFLFVRHIQCHMGI